MILMETMKNYSLYDYVIWRGDLPLSADPFNEVDNVVLCELCYVDFSPALGKEGTEEKTLRECAGIIREKGAYVLKTLEGGQEEFFLAAGASARFGDIRVRNYIEIMNAEENLQFSAMEFVLDDRTSYIAFRGTDNSLIGWKEDFTMSFSMIAGQEYAAQYLRDVIRPFRKYYVGGHSKGGNLAMYACARLPKMYRNRILRLYNNDGPGFSSDFMDITQLEPYSSRMVRIIPVFCIVGSIFTLPYGKTKIVGSSVNGVMQHDLITWQTAGRRLKEEEKNDDISERVNEGVRAWLENLTPENREAFVNEMYSALTAGGAATVQEITGKGFIKVLSAAVTASNDSKKLVRELAGIMLKSGVPWPVPADK